MDVAPRFFIVIVAVLLEYIKRPNMAVFEEVVAVADVLPFEVTLAVVSHDGIKDIFQTTGAALIFLIYKSLGELHISPPIESRGLIVVLPIHQGAAAIEFIVELNSPSCSKSQLSGFIGCHI